MYVGGFICVCVCLCLCVCVCVCAVGKEVLVYLCGTDYVKFYDILGDVTLPL